VTGHDGEPPPQSVRILTSENVTDQAMQLPNLKLFEFQPARMLLTKPYKIPTAKSQLQKKNLTRDSSFLLLNLKTKSGFQVTLAIRKAHNIVTPLFHTF